MTKNKQKNGFDCVAFKREAQERIYGQLKNLSRSEEIEYFEIRTEKGVFADWLKKIREVARI